MKFMTDAQAAAIAAERKKQNKAIFDFVNAHPLEPRTYAQIKSLVQSGHGPEIFNVGDEIPCTYTYNGTTYDFPYIVGDPDCTSIVMYGEEEIEVPSVLIFPKYCTIERIPFDELWHENVKISEKYAVEGRYYCGRNGYTYTMLDLNVGDEIPVGEYNDVYYGVINNSTVYQNGYNNYIYSVHRAWLNSSAAAGHWLDGFTRLDGQSIPSLVYNDYAGFMAGLPVDFLAMVGPTKQAFACNTLTDDGRTEYFYDTFFDMSAEQMYFVPQAEEVEGPYIKYWKEATGLDTPSNAPNPGRIIKACDNPTGPAQNIWLRSCINLGGTSRRGANSNFFCSTNGESGIVTSNGRYRALPACFIR